MWKSEILRKVNLFIFTEALTDLQDASQLQI